MQTCETRRLGCLEITVSYVNFYFKSIVCSFQNLHGSDLRENASKRWLSLSKGGTQRNIVSANTAEIFKHRLQKGTGEPRNLSL